MLATPDDRQAVEAIEKLTGGTIERVQVEGLDPVEWAEGGDKRRRGRKAKPSDKKAETKPAAKAEAKPRAGKTGAKTTDKSAVKAPPRPASEPIEPQLDLAHAPQPMLPSLPERPEPPRPAPPRVHESRHETRAPEMRHPPRRPEARDRRPREDEPAASVVGFGADTPAFMLIRAWRRPATPADAAPERLELVP